MYQIFSCSRAAVFDNHELGLTIDQIQQRTGATYVLGGWVFDNDKSSPTYLQPYNWLKVDGKVIHRDDFREWRFTAGKTGAPVFATETEAPDILSGVPVLVDGARVYRSLTPDVARNAARQAVCWMPDGRIMLWASKTAMSREELQDALVKLGVCHALMMDGGGSVQLRGPDLCIKSGRILASLLLFWEQEPVEPPKFTVCIDAGHDAGNKVNASPDGTYYEAEFTLDMGKRVSALLREAGVGVIETRPDGKAVSLSQRCQIANEAHVDLFVSLHSNAGPQAGWSSPRGLEVHIFKKGIPAERCAQAVVDRMREVGIVLRPYPVVVKELYVLKHTAMTAILVEHGFHTNREDVALLKTAAYRALLALQDAKGILDYLGVPVPAAWAQEPETVPEAVPEAQVPPAPQLWDQASPAHREGVRWAVEQGIIQGNAEGDLMPRDPVTREQLCTMLFRAQGKMG